MRSRVRSSRPAVAIALAAGTAGKFAGTAGAGPASAAPPSDFADTVINGPMDIALNNTVVSSGLVTR